MGRENQIFGTRVVAVPHPENRYRRVATEAQRHRGQKEQRNYRRTRPRRMPRATASVRVAAPSLPRMAATWNLAVWSEILRRAAISLLARPAASIWRTSRSRRVSGSGGAGRGGEGGAGAGKGAGR